MIRVEAGLACHTPSRFDYRSLPKETLLELGRMNPRTSCRPFLFRDQTWGTWRKICVKFNVKIMLPQWNFWGSAKLRSKSSV